MLSLIEREIIDDRMLKERKVLQGSVVSYEQRKAARGSRVFWVPIVRVSAGATIVDIPDQHKFFYSKPDAKTNNQQVVTLDFLTDLSILRVRESYAADKPRLIRNDLFSLLLGVLIYTPLLFAWIRRQKPNGSESKA